MTVLFIRFSANSIRASGEEGSHNVLVQSAVRELREMLVDYVLDVLREDLLHSVEEVPRGHIPLSGDLGDVFLYHDVWKVVRQLSRRSPARCQLPIHLRMPYKLTAALASLLRRRISRCHLSSHPKHPVPPLVRSLVD